MVAATSKDGFLTKDNNPNPRGWTSVKDKALYRKLLAEYNLYLIGSTTYGYAKHSLPAPTHKIVMTSHRTIDEIPRVTFSDQPFEKILHEVAKTYDQLLVLGGASIYHQMLTKGLIDEIYLTIEPVVHTTGVRLSENGILSRCRVRDFRAEITHCARYTTKTLHCS